MKPTDWGGVKRARAKRKFKRNVHTFSVGLIAFALGGFFGPSIPMLRLETAYRLQQIKNSVKSTQNIVTPSITSNPLQNEDGSVITPVDNQFGLVIPKIGVNAPVIAGVNPAKPAEYQKALAEGIAHASTSYLPDQDGSVYLFSHSTNYDWFVKDLNAVFYLLKNVNEGDKVIIMYKSIPYTYIITGKRVVSPSAVSYLVPQAGVKRLILQTCWPPGSTTERLLIFADLIP